jgi:hypothetical protein
MILNMLTKEYDRNTFSIQLLASSFTIETTTATITNVEPFSSTNVRTTSNINRTTTTTTEDSAPSGLFLNPVFDGPNRNQEYGDTPWILGDSLSCVCLY